MDYRGKPGNDERKSDANCIALAPCGTGHRSWPTQVRLGEWFPPAYWDAETTPHPSRPSLRSRRATVSHKGRGENPHNSSPSAHMNLQFLIQLLVNGLGVGTLYGLVAMACVL